MKNKQSLFRGIVAAGVFMVVTNSHATEPLTVAHANIPPTSGLTFSPITNTTCAALKETFGDTSNQPSLCILDAQENSAPLPEITIPEVVTQNRQP